MSGPWHPMARLVQLARTPVPLPRWLPRRRARRSIKDIVRESGLPEALGAMVLDVVKRARLWRSEQADVADELMGHLRDGLESGADPAALVSSFGAPAVVAKLIRRAIRRKRPLAWRAWRRSRQGAAALLGLLVVVYLYAFIRFFGGTPAITHDYLAEINAPILALAPQQRAWPMYRTALLALRDLPEPAWNARPGQYGWTELACEVQSHAPALAMVREAASRPALGYLASFTIDAADRALWPDHADNTASQAGLIAIVLPYLKDLRRLNSLLAVEMRSAAAAGDGELVAADLLAALRMAGHVRAIPTIISDLVSLAMVSKMLDTFSGILGADPQIFSDAQLRRLAHEIAALDHQRLRVRFDGEKMWFEDLLQRVYSDDGHGDGHVTVAGIQALSAGLPIGIDMHPNPRMYVAGPAVALVMAGRRDMAAMYDRLVNRAEAECAKPLWEQDTGAFDREISAMQGSLVTKARYLPVLLLVSGLGHAGQQSELAAQRRDAVLVAMALELDHRRNGAWPETLGALVPDLLPAVPPDRFDGKPLRYRVVDGKPLLYSVGRDRDDDNATPTASQQPGLYLGDGDWILWQEPGSQEQ